MTRRRIAACGLLVAVALVAGACGNAWGVHNAASGESPGVTPTEIIVGGVASITSPVGDNFKYAAEGVKAYFEMVNSEGGVYGRKLRLVAEYDDNTQASKNIAAVRTLVEEDGVFAVMPVATPIFAGGPYLAEARVPTFGWVINPEWALSDALFGGGNDGDICLDCAETFTYLPMIAKLMGAERVGVVAYSAAQSKQCAEGQQAALDKFGFDVPFADSSLTFGFTDVSAQVARIKDADLELLATCMDGDGSARLSKALNEAGVKLKQYWPIGYDPNLLEQFPDEMEGIYVQTTFVPFEIPGSSAGMKKYLDWVDRTGGQVGEASMQGWLNADLFVAGLKEAGPEPTREKLIEGIYSLTDYDADDIILPVDWTKMRDADKGFNKGDVVPVCLGFVTVDDAEFKPVFVTEEEPWACVDISKNTLPSEPQRPKDLGL